MTTDQEGGLFAAIHDPSVRYVVEDGISVSEVNAAYADVFEVDRATTGELETRLRTDLEGDESGAGLAPVDAITDLVEGARQGDPVETIARANTPGGERDYLARVVPRGDDGGQRGYLVLTDITAQRDRTREILKQRDRLDEFASIVSHDLRNPLEVAKIQLEAAQQRGDDVHFEKVDEAHERMERIIEDVLALARQGRVIDDVGEATLSLVAADAWDSISAPAASMTVAEDAILEADPDRLQELLENLFRNAIEHGTDDGQADVTVTVAATGDGFYVADDGQGIPEDQQDQVFDGGFSTSTEGTGLGLVIVDRIAEAHGWDVSVGTAENGGARFEFSGVGQFR